MSIINITVNNWDKYNPRTDRKNYSWFRMENNFFTDPCIFSLDSKQKVLLIYIFCETSKKCTGDCVLNLNMASSVTGLPLNNVKKALQVLETLEFINTGVKKTQIDANRRSTNVTNVTNERTNDTNEVMFFDFDIAYSQYINKKGKPAAMRHFEAQIKTQVDFDNLLKGIENYNAECRENDTPKKYQKHFSTFMNKQWLDYVHVEKSKKQEATDYFLGLMKENEGKPPAETIINSDGSSQIV